MGNTNKFMILIFLFDTFFSGTVLAEWNTFTSEKEKRELERYILKTSKTMAKNKTIFVSKAKILKGDDVIWFKNTAMDGENEKSKLRIFEK